jgi:hypothetical protein
MRKNSPVGVVLKGLTKQKIQVLALESKRSVSWIISDFIDTILAQPELHERVIGAARFILAKDPTFSPALAISRQTQPTSPTSAQVEPEVDKQPARVQQPVFTLSALAPTKDLGIRTRGARPAQSMPTPAEAAPPAPPEVEPAAEYVPEPGDARPARGLLFG